MNKLNTIVIVTIEGNTTSDINYEWNGIPKVVKDLPANRMVIEALIASPDYDVTWENRDSVGNIINSSPYDQSPMYNQES